MGKVTEAEVRRALDDVDFPADKASLLVHAERNQAGEEVRKQLRALPPVSYDNLAEILASITTAEAAEEPSPSERALRQRARHEGRRDRIAEHLREPDPEAEAERIPPQDEAP